MPIVKKGIVGIAAMYGGIAASGAASEVESSSLAFEQGSKSSIESIIAPEVGGIALYAEPPSGYDLHVSETFFSSTKVRVGSKAIRANNQMQLTTPPEPPPPPLRIPNYENWLKIAACESNMRWDINSGNGYYGGLQFRLSSWRAAGGLQYAPRPHLASAAQQMLTAEILLSMQGWQAWPTCSRKVGLR